MITTSLNCIRIKRKVSCGKKAQELSYKWSWTCQDAAFILHDRSRPLYMIAQSMWYQDWARDQRHTCLVYSFVERKIKIEFDVSVSAGLKQLLSRKKREAVTRSRNLELRTRNVLTPNKTSGLSLNFGFQVFKKASVEKRIPHICCTYVKIFEQNDKKH